MNLFHVAYQVKNPCVGVAALSHIKHATVLGKNAYAAKCRLTFDLMAKLHFVSVTQIEGGVVHHK